MLQRCVLPLLLLLLTLPTASWARTVTVTVGKSSTKLTPQQVQFMRWWRSKTQKTVKPVTSTKPLTTRTSVTTVKAVTVKPTTLVKTAKPAVKPVKLGSSAVTSTRKITPPVKGQPVSVPVRNLSPGPVKVPVHHVPATTTQGSVVPSLLTLKTLLVNAQASAAAKFSGLGGARLTVVRVKRRASTRRSERIKQRRQRTTVLQSAKKLVIVDSSQQGDTSAPPSALTTLRYQLELSQME